MKNILLLLLIFIVGCGDSTNTTTNTNDNRICLTNEKEESQPTLFQDALSSGVEPLQGMEQVIMCGDPVIIDSVVETNNPPALAKFLAEGKVYAGE